MKKCTKCNIDKPFTDFHKNKKSKDGYTFSCKQCTKSYYKNNKESRDEYQKQYYQENKDEQYLKNRERYLNNKERYDETTNKWREKNKERLRERQRKYMKEYRQKSLSYRLRDNIGHYIYNALQGTKSGSYKKYLGCSIKEYKLYLEQQFNENMNWENYGTYWEIDHINPISSFNLLEENEAKQAFHFTNTQPLTIEENRKKSNKSFG